MIMISKDESKHLAAKGFEWGHELFHTTGKRHRTYYVGETERVLSALEQYRKNITKPAY